MSKKPLSNMTGSDFVRIIGALNLRQSQLARALGRSAATISAYSTGRQPIPMDIVEKIRNMINERIAQVEAAGHVIKKATQEQAISSLIITTNEIKRAAPPDRLPKLCRRMEPEDGRVYPAYRMHHSKFQVFVQALSNYHLAVHARRQQASDIRDIKQYDRELADLRVLATNMSGLSQRGAPYDVLITRSEWFVVGRALRHEVTPEKYALYQHWRIHKGAGYPRA